MRRILQAVFIVLTSVSLGQPSGWLFNQPITVNNTNSVNAVDYQLRMVINTQSLVTAGMMLSSGNDIRFGGTCTGSSFFNYWIEAGINTPTTVIWVKIPFIAASSSTVIYMFFGNSGAAAASAIPGTFRGPNSSTDSVSGGTSGGVASSQRGFRFQPTQDLLVTHFGKYEAQGTTRYVTIFNYTSTAIVSQTQVSGPASTYSYGPIPSPVWLQNGIQYVVQLYQGSGDGYMYQSSSQIGQHLTYLDMRYCNSCTQNTFPTSVLSNYHYGYPDFLYYITNTLAVTPGYTLTSLGSIAASPAASICAGQNVTLTAVIPNATTYTWSTGVSGSVIVVAPSSNTSYSVETVSGSGCTIKTIINVTVSPGIPTLAVTASTNQVCLGRTATLTASGALSYTWNNGVQNGVGFTPTVTSSYVVTGMNGCGSSTAAVTITVAPLPVAAVVSPTLTCAGQPATLAAVAAATGYTWLPMSQPTASTLVSPAVNTSYTIIATDGTCSGTSVVSLSVNPVPTLMIAGTATAVCAAGSVTLTASGAGTYTWSGGGLNSNNPVTTASPSAATLYNVAGTNSFNCTSSASYPVVVKQTPTVSASATNTYVCLGDMVTLNAAGAQVYNWSSGGTLSTETVVPVSTTIYTVTGTNTTTSCSDTKTVVVGVYSPSITVLGNTAVCQGETAVLVAAGATEYYWIAGIDSPSIGVTPQANQVYTVSTVTQTNGITCPSSATVEVVVHPNPTITLVASRAVICRNESVVLTASGAASFTWNPSTTGSTLAVTHSVVGSPAFSVAGTSSLGCPGTASTTIKVNACTGIEAMDIKPFVISPNPSAGEFHLSADGPARIEVYDQAGRLVATFLLGPENGYKASVSTLAAGVYILRSGAGGHAYEEKLIITR